MAYWILLFLSLTRTDKWNRAIKYPSWRLLRSTKHLCEMKLWKFWKQRTFLTSYKTVWMWMFNLIRISFHWSIFPCIRKWTDWTPCNELQRYVFECRDIILIFTFNFDCTKNGKEFPVQLSRTSFFYLH